MIEPKTDKQRKQLGLSPRPHLKGNSFAKKCSTKKKSESVKVTMVPGSTKLIKLIMERRNIKSVAQYLRKLVADDIRREFGAKG